MEQLHSPPHQPGTTLDRTEAILGDDDDDDSIDLNSDDLKKENPNKKSIPNRPGACLLQLSFGTFLEECEEQYDKLPPELKRIVDVMLKVRQHITSDLLTVVTADFEGFALVDEALTFVLTHKTVVPWQVRMFAEGIEPFREAYKRPLMQSLDTHGLATLASPEKPKKKRKMKPDVH